MTKSTPSGARGPWTVESAAADLHRRIIDNEFRLADGSPGKLPPAGDLGAHYGLSRQAMNRVIEKLKAQGMVATRPGSAGAAVLDWKPLVFLPQQEFDTRGASIAEQETDIYTRLVQAARRTGTARMDDVTVMPAEEPVRSKLGLKEGQHVAVRTRTNMVDGVAVHTDDSFVPLQLVDGSDWLLPGNVERGTNTVLAELGHEIVRSIDELAPRLTTPDENARLGLGEGNSTPAIELISTNFDRAGRAVQVVVFILPSHRNKVVYDRSRPASKQDCE